MVNRADISSTERLLDVIRDTHQSPDISGFSHPSPSPRLAKKILTKLSLKKLAHVGAVIEDNTLYLAKAAVSKKTGRILEVKSVSIKPEIAKDRDRLVQLLYAELEGFCQTTSPASLWVGLPADQVDIRCLRIPKVAKNQIANAVYWTYQKETQLDKDQILFDFDVIGEAIENGVLKLEVLACTAPRHEVEALKRLFVESGTTPTGISAGSFAIQNFLRTQWIDADNTLSCCLSIGTSWSRIDVFRPNGVLIVSRGIKAGMTSMIESIKNEAAHSTGTIAMPAENDDDAPILELPVFDKTEADQLLEVLNIDAPTVTSGAGGLLAPEDVFEMVLPALERLIRQVERTLEHVTLKFTDGPVQKLFVAGPICAYPRLVKHIGNQLSMSYDTINPFGAMAQDGSIPATVYEQSAFTIPVGLALADNAHTPNFLFTHTEEDSQVQKQKLNQLIVAALFVGIFLLGGYHLVLKRQHDQKKQQIEALEGMLTAAGEETEKDGILQLADEIKKKHRMLRDSSSHYLPVAAVGEIANLAPSYIRYIRVDGRTTPLPADADILIEDMSDTEENTSADTPKKTPRSQTIIDIEGIVYGPHYSFDSRLAGYLIELKQSPLFNQVTLKKKLLSQVDNKEVLQFTVAAEIVPNK